jgi:hypothetical protein
MYWEQNWNNKSNNAEYRLQDSLKTKYTSSTYQVTIQALCPQAPVARRNFEFRAENKISRNDTWKAGWSRFEFRVTREVAV